MPSQGLKWSRRIAGLISKVSFHGIENMLRPAFFRSALLIALLILLVSVACGRNDNGFDLTGSLVPADQIHLGGPPRDGIPSIDRPEFIAAADASFLAEKDRVLGLARDDQARAYPIAIMNWHEVVNDRFGEDSIAVTYCPLCGTGMAFRSDAGGRRLSFGVSGLLYNSDVLLYDRGTESLWSQLLMRAVAGPLKGERLTQVPLAHTSWGAWKAEHPDTKVLSTETGFRRDYGQDPYAGYSGNVEVYFPVSASSRRYHPKERVLGLAVDGRFKAYPFAELSRTGHKEISDRFAGLDLTIRFDRTAESARAFDADGRELAAVSGFWFAWFAFHPETEVFSADNVGAD